MDKHDDDDDSPQKQKYLRDQLYQTNDDVIFRCSTLWRKIYLLLLSLTKKGHNSPFIDLIIITVFTSV